MWALNSSQWVQRFLTHETARDFEQTMWFDAILVDFLKYLKCLAPNYNSNPKWPLGYCVNGWCGRWIVLKGCRGFWRTKRRVISSNLCDLTLSEWIPLLSQWISLSIWICLATNSNSNLKWPLGYWVDGWCGRWTVPRGCRGFWRTKPRVISSKLCDLTLS